MTANETNIIYPDLSYTSPLPLPPAYRQAGAGKGKGEGLNGYNLGILVNFSKGKAEYRRVIIR
jgi:hypothetical protein